MVLLMLTITAYGEMGCGAAQTQMGELNDDLRQVTERLNSDSEKNARVENLDGELEGYLRYAMISNPALKANYELWRAQVARVGASGKLPEPILSYGLFIRRIETRVGPQRHKFGLRQRLPWPDKLAASTDFEVASARAHERLFEARALNLKRSVSDAWWRLWSIHQAKQVRREQLSLLNHMTASVRGRMQVGGANISEISQLDLVTSRLADKLATLGAKERSAAARLVSAIGAPAGTKTPISLRQLIEMIPDESEQDLMAAARQHPRVQAQSMLIEQSEASKRSAEADRFPNIILGLDYIETGEHDGAMVQDDNGKDPLLATVSLELPIWIDVYAAAEAAADATKRARIAQKDNIEAHLQAELQDALSVLGDSARRIKLFRDTLIPQGRTAYLAALGDYEIGQVEVASMILAYRELLELRLGLITAQADHARSWSWLESVAGRSVRAKEVTP